RPRVVLHAVLRNPACGSGPAHGRPADVLRSGPLHLPALARSLAGEVDALPRLDVADGARDFRRLVPRADVSGAAARRGRIRASGPHFHGAVLRILPAYADLHQTRDRQAGPGES